MNFIFDIDGTICFQGKPVSPKILDALFELKQAGHLIGFASARPCRDMLPVLDERFYDGLLIGGNGAMTYYERKLIHLFEISRPLYEHMVDIFEQFQASYLVDLAWDYYYKGTESHPFLQKVDPGRLGRRVERDSVELVAKVLVTECEDAQALKAKIKQLDLNIHQHSDEQVLDMTAISVDKMKALQQFGIQPREFICFGNDTNDIPMFKEARHAVMIGEHSELSAYAAEKIPVHDELEDELIAAVQRLAG